jgi:hypothetical protein
LRELLDLYRHVSDALIEVSPIDKAHGRTLHRLGDSSASR